MNIGQYCLELEKLDFKSERKYITLIKKYINAQWVRWRGLSLCSSATIADGEEGEEFPPKDICKITHNGTTNIIDVNFGKQFKRYMWFW